MDGKFLMFPLVWFLRSDLPVVNSNVVNGCKWAIEFDGVASMVIF